MNARCALEMSGAHVFVLPGAAATSGALPLATMWVLLPHVAQIDRSDAQGRGRHRFCAAILRQMGDSPPQWDAPELVQKSL